MPLGILYVSSVAKAAGLNIIPLNLNHVADPQQALGDCIEHNHIDVVASGGLSGEFSSIYPIFEFVKQRYPHVITVVGGGLVTASPEVALQALQYADLGIIGEGEYVFVDLIRALQKGAELSRVPGLIVRRFGQLVRTPPPHHILDLNLLPLPDYEGFEYDAYLQRNSGGLGWHQEKLSPASIIGSRACPYSCTFCFHPTGDHYRERPLDSIFTEIDYLRSRYNINYISLREELFAVNKERIKDFCRMIAAYDIYWSLQLRIDQVSVDLFEMLKKSNCFYVYLGIESLDDRVLKSMRKNITARMIKDTLKMAREVGIMVRSGLIFGDKAETRDSAEATLNWLSEQPDDYAAVFKRPAIIADMLIPFPGTALYKFACDSGIIKEQEQYLADGCPVVNLTSLSDEVFQQVIQKVQTVNHRSYSYFNGHETVMLPYF